MTDKRHSPRLNRRFILRAATVGEEPLRWSFVTIQNLSATGVFFTYDRPVYPAMLMHLKIDFPDRMIQCMGRVVRVGEGPGNGNHPAVAMRLEGMNPEDQEYVEGFVRQNLA